MLFAGLGGPVMNTTTSNLSLNERIGFLIALLAMISVVVASNYLVQFPVNILLGGLNLADLLTWGAFT